MTRWRVGDRLYTSSTPRRASSACTSRTAALRHRFGPYDANGTGTRRTRRMPGRRSTWPTSATACSSSTSAIRRSTRIAPGAESLRKMFRRPCGFRAEVAPPCRRRPRLPAALGWLERRGRPRRSSAAGYSARNRRASTQARASIAPSRRRRLRRLRSASRATARRRNPRTNRRYCRSRRTQRRGVWTSQWLDSDLYNCQWHRSNCAVDAPARIAHRGSHAHEQRAAVRARRCWRRSDASATAGLAGHAGARRPGAARCRGRDAAHDRRARPERAGQYLQLADRADGQRARHAGRSRACACASRASRCSSTCRRSTRSPRSSASSSIASSRSRRRRGRRSNRKSTPSSAISIPTRCPPSAAVARRLARPAARGHVEGRAEPPAVAGDAGASRELGHRGRLRAWLRVYLANLGGVDERALEDAGIPGIVESFVDRRRLMLNRPGAATLCSADGLWSPAVERRFQVGVFDREGEVELVSIGRPGARRVPALRAFVPGRTCPRLGSARRPTRR